MRKCFCVVCFILTWLCHKMETFSALLALCEGNLPFVRGFSSQSPVTRSFGVFFDLCLNKRLRKQSRCWWFEMPWCSLWRHCIESTDQADYVWSTTSGLLMAFGDIDQSQRCLTQSLSAWQHQTISLNIDLSSVRPNNIHPRTILQKIHQA